MSSLSNALEKIISWLQKHQPEFADSFLPGIKIDKIKKIEKEIGFKLSEEICELYQCRTHSYK